MKVLPKPGVLFLLLLGLLGGARAGAQDFTLSVSNSPNPVFTGDTLTYTINVTNLASAGGEVFVTNFLSPFVQFVSAGSSIGGMISSNIPGQVIFQLGISFPPATLTVNVIPANSGPLTNVVAVGTLGVNDTVTVTNFDFAINPTASVGLTIAGPSSAVVANDWMTYSVAVTNTGSNAANNVVLSNTLPAGVGLIGVTPSSPVFTFSNNVMVFNLGSFPVGAGDTFFFTVQPTNSGALTNVTLTFTASAGASHATNVTVTNSITVLPFNTNDLVAANFSSMAYDAQNGLMEQTIQLSNIGTNAVAGARVIVSGLTNLLYNAVGTNNGNPFVQYGASLGAGQSVNLLMEYFVPTRQPITVPNSAYAAVPVPAPNLSPPAGTPVNITLITSLADGRVLIEFPATPGRSYTILYANNPSMTNAFAAQPAVVAPADEVQWLDFGPPDTVSAPTNVPARFYSVRLNP